MNQMNVGDSFAGIAGPLGRPSEINAYDPATETVVFTAGGLGLPPVYPIAREHLRRGNHVTLIAGFRSASLLFWTGEDERMAGLQREFPDTLEVIYATNDGTFGVEGFVTTPLETMLEAARAGTGRRIAEVVTVGPPLMMRAVADLAKKYDVHTVASLNSIMVDATGMCGACMVPVTIEGKTVRKHACIDGPEIDAHIIDWDKSCPASDNSASRSRPAGPATAWLEGRSLPDATRGQRPAAVDALDPKDSGECTTRRKHRVLTACRALSTGVASRLRPARPAR